MCGTLNYVKDDFRNEELTTIKLYNFQREAFLHHFKYDNYMTHLQDFILTHNIQSVVFNPYPEHYLLRLYKDGSYAHLLDLT
jgi:hypothetical protein